jgi:hypothetical protein
VRAACVIVCMCFISDHGDHIPARATRTWYYCSTKTYLQPATHYACQGMCATSWVAQLHLHAVPTLSPTASRPPPPLFFSNMYPHTHTLQAPPQHVCWCWWVTVCWLPTWEIQGSWSYGMERCVQGGERCVSVWWSLGGGGVIRASNGMARRQGAHCRRWQETGWASLSCLQLDLSTTADPLQCYQGRWQQLTRSPPPQQQH